VSSIGILDIGKGRLRRVYWDGRFVFQYSAAACLYLSFDKRWVYATDAWVRKVGNRYVALASWSANLFPVMPICAGHQCISTAPYEALRARSLVSQACL
jgi:hypothetical protein